MAYRAVVTDEAYREALNAYLYYEEIQIGLGTRFLKSLQKRYDQLSQNPQFYSFVYADKEKTLRDIKLEGFPFVILYDVEEYEVVVYSVHNTYKNRE